MDLFSTSLLMHRPQKCAVSGDVLLPRLRVELWLAMTLSNGNQVSHGSLSSHCIQQVGRWVELAEI